MTDNQMMMALIIEIENQFNMTGVTNFEVSRNQQPTNQYTGADKDDAIKTRVFLYAIANPGNGKSRNYFYKLTPNLRRADMQHRAKSIQVSVIHAFDEAKVESMTPEDMCNLVHDLLDSPDAIRNLRKAGVFLQSVGDVRPIFFVNDKDGNESSPNFDITVNYTSVIVKGSAIITEATGVIERV